MNRKLLALVVSQLLMPINSFAMDATATQSEQTSYPTQQLALVGQGTLSYLFWDVYLAKLYTQNGRYQRAIKPIAIEFTYLRDFTAEQLIEETVEQWQDLGFDAHPNQRSWIEQLKAVWPDVKQGSTLLFYITEQGTSRFFYNKELMGEIVDSEFSEQLLAIWLSEKTNAPTVRKKLIGVN